MIISLDTETTGIDLAHGAVPFLVTTCDDGGGLDAIRYWEWDVDPTTRRPEIPSGDLEDVAELIDAADLIYLQNAKFDARALRTVGLELPWAKVRDTLVMGHLLGSNLKHDLTSMCVDYLGVDIGPLEDTVEEVVRTCRQVVRRDYPHWRIAEEGADGMPSVKDSGKRDDDKPWKNDMWLPRALHTARYRHNRTPGVPFAGTPDPNWLVVCSEYANADSEHTLYLGLEMERIICERGLWSIYEHRLHLPRIACEMEERGITTIGNYTDRTIREYEEYVAEEEAELVEIAARYGHNLELASGAAINDNMRDFFYGAVWQECPRCQYRKRVKHWLGESPDGGACPKCTKSTRRRAGVRHNLVTGGRDNLALPVVGKPGSGRKKSVAASLDKDAMVDYLTTADGDAYDFVKLLADKRKHNTDLTYMCAYRRYWLPETGAPGYYRIHPSFNPFGTDHLRWSSNNPNLQNVGDQEDRCERCDGAGCPACGESGRTRTSVRACFGPLPHREWWRMDYKNLEKRIPAYECMEPKLVEIFEKPGDPPYWGSDHGLIASLLYPDEYWPLADTDGAFKKRHPHLAKKAKGVNFAKQYGAGRRKVDTVSGVLGAFDRIDRGLPELAKLQARYLREAERTGYVETLPNRTVDSRRGYPILAGRTDEGRVLSTTPFNYHVSGTACEVKNQGLIKCDEQLERWRRKDEFDAYISIEVHDEILFDFPRGAAPGDNLPRALALRDLMESCGADLVPSIPTPVHVEYVADRWSEGVVM